LPATALVEVKIAAPLQVALFGPNRVKVIVPAGLTPAESMAVSLTVPPTGTVPDAVVFRVGVALPTTTLSLGSLHKVVTAVLLASPL
jgi:hypothetical protein